MGLNGCLGDHGILPTVAIVVVNWKPISPIYFDDKNGVENKHHGDVPQSVTLTIGHPMHVFFFFSGVYDKIGIHQWI